MRAWRSVHTSAPVADNSVWETQRVELPGYSVDTGLALGHSRAVGTKRITSIGVVMAVSEGRVASAFDRLAAALESGVPRRTALKMALGLGVAAISSLLPFPLLAADDSPSSPSSSGGAGEALSGTPFLQACTRLQVGSVCTFTVGDKTLSGVCQQDARGILVCVPPPPSTAPPLVQACVDHQAGSSCTFNFGDKTLSGVCQQDARGILVCVPPPPSTAPPLVQACVDHQAGSTCTFNFGDKTLSGVCQPDGRGVLVCVPSPQAAPPPLQACVGQSPGSACTFTVAGHDLSGVCLELKSGVLICAPVSTPTA
jgi:hypothetical protein